MLSGDDMSHRRYIDSSVDTIVHIPVVDIDSEVTNNLVRAASGFPDIEKDAKFLVAFNKFYKEHSGSTSETFKHCLLNFKHA